MTQYKDEIYKCARNPIYFLCGYGHIQHPIRGLIKFDLYPHQKDYIKNLLSFRFNIILKARQLGITEVTAGYIVWLCLFARDKTVIVVSKDQDAAKEIIRRARILFTRLPGWLKIASLTKDNVHSLEFSNRSRIQSLGRTKDVARSKAASLLVVDEAAAIPWLEEMLTSAQPIISTGGNCILLSTPKGINYFYKLYSDAENGLNNYQPMKLHWSVHPEHDQKWFSQETRSMTKQQIAQEFECNFVGSGDTLIDGDKLEEIKKTILPADSPLIIKNHFLDKNFWIFKKNEPHKAYVLAADPARGDSTDYSTLQVLDASIWEQVAEYKGQMPTDDFGKLIVQVARMYNNCGVVVENTGGLGVAVMNEMNNQKYTNIYYTVRGTTNCIPYRDTVLYQDRVVQGFSTTLKSRPLIMNKLEQAIRNDLVKFYSPRLLEEFRTFKWINQKPQAERGYNDDLVLAMAMALWVVDRVSMTSQRDHEYVQAFLKSTSVESNTFDELYEESSNMKGRQDPNLFQVNLPNGYGRKRININLKEFMD